MNPWKWLALILLALAVVLGVALAVAHFRLATSEAIVEEYVSGELTRQGYVPGEYEKPKIPDAPLGSTPLARVGGTVRYAPIPRSPGSPTPDPTTSPVHETAYPSEVEAGAPLTPCRLDDLDVSINCLAEVMAEPSRPWARLLTSGTISGWGQVRELPPTQASTMELSVSKTVVPPKWRLDLLGGVAVGSRPGVEFGATWTGKTRLGGYLLAEWQPSEAGSSVYVSEYEGYTTVGGTPATWRLHGGIRVRVK